MKKIFKYIFVSLLLLSPAITKAIVFTPYQLGTSTPTAGFVLQSQGTSTIASWVNASTLRLSQTPWTSNINGGGYLLTNAVLPDYLKLNQTTPQTTVGTFIFPEVVSQYIYGSASGLGSIDLTDSLDTQTANVIIGYGQVSIMGGSVVFNGDGSGYFSDGNITFSSGGINTPALLDNSNVISVSPIDRGLRDSSGIFSMDWQNRLLYSTVGGGYPSLDYQGRALLDLAGANIVQWGTGIFNLLGQITKYNNIVTVSGGVPAEYATVDRTGLAAAVTATTLYTPTANGMFRISIVLQVTRAASTSSILGGTTGVVITYTEPDGSVAQSIVPLLTSQTGAVIIPATGNIGNTTTTQSQGSAIIYAKTGVNIKYAIGYTSVGATSMLYAAHLKVEAL